MRLIYFVFDWGAAGAPATGGAFAAGPDGAPGAAIPEDDTVAAAGVAGAVATGDTADGSAAMAAVGGTLTAVVAVARVGSGTIGSSEGGFPELF